VGLINVIKARNPQIQSTQCQWNTIGESKNEMSVWFVNWIEEDNDNKINQVIPSEN
jgi:hypothetical protein